MNNQIVFKAEGLMPVILEARKNNCSVLLVKDKGVYMMSEIRDRDESGKHKVCYAINCNPHIDEDWHEYVESVMGEGYSCESFNPRGRIFNTVIRHEIDVRVKIKETKSVIYL